MEQNGPDCPGFLRIREALTILRNDRKTPATFANLSKLIYEKLSTEDGFTMFNVWEWLERAELEGLLAEVEEEGLKCLRDSEAVKEVREIKNGNDLRLAVLTSVKEIGEEQGATRERIESHVASSFRISFPRELLVEMVEKALLDLCNDGSLSQTEQLFMLSGEKLMEEQSLPSSSEIPLKCKPLHDQSDLRKPLRQKKRRPLFIPRKKLSSSSYLKRLLRTTKSRIFRMKSKNFATPKRSSLSRKLDGKRLRKLDAVLNSKRAMNSPKSCRKKPASTPYYSPSSNRTGPSSSTDRKKKKSKRTESNHSSNELNVAASPSRKRLSNGETPGTAELNRNCPFSKNQSKQAESNNPKGADFSSKKRFSNGIIGLNSSVASSSTNGLSHDESSRRSESIASSTNDVNSRKNRIAAGGFDGAGSYWTAKPRERKSYYSGTYSFLPINDNVPPNPPKKKRERKSRKAKEVAKAKTAEMLSLEGAIAEKSDTGGSSVASSPGPSLPLRNRIARKSAGVSIHARTVAEPDSDEHLGKTPAVPRTSARKATLVVSGETFRLIPAPETDSISHKVRSDGVHVDLNRDYLEKCPLDDFAFGPSEDDEEEKLPFGIDLLKLSDDSTAFLREASRRSGMDVMDFVKELLSEESRAQAKDVVNLILSTPE